MPHCKSRVLYKGALQGQKAHTVWIGDVLIRKAAEGTDTYEMNRNLVLTSGARADSVPNLEIETGEIVGAGHASATGRFDDEQLFYLLSRGIPSEVAQRLVVRGFFGEVLLQHRHSVRPRAGGRDHRARTGHRRHLNATGRPGHPKIRAAARQTAPDEPRHLESAHMATLDIRDLHVSVTTDEGPMEILKGVDLTISSNETHAIMGPNGSGKSTLAYSLAGHPKYQVTRAPSPSTAQDLLAMTVDARARAGLFLAMQYPVEVPGVSTSNFLRTAATAVRGEAPPIRKWVKEVKTAMKRSGDRPGCSPSGR